MQLTREQAAEHLLKSYSVHYDIHRDIEGVSLPLLARCEYHEYSEKYVLIKKARIWEADCEDFLYLFNTEKLTVSLMDKCRKYAWEDGMSKAHIGPGHMYSYVTVIFLCDEMEEAARGALKKYKDSKSFLFSLHGWVTLRAVGLTLPGGEIISNWNGREAAKVLSEVLYPKTNLKRREKK